MIKKNDVRLTRPGKKKKAHHVQNDDIIFHDGYWYHVDTVEIDWPNKKVLFTFKEYLHCSSAEYSVYRRIMCKEKDD